MPTPSWTDRHGFQVEGPDGHRCCYWELWTRRRWLKYWTATFISWPLALCPLGLDSCLIALWACAFGPCKHISRLASTSFSTARMTSICLPPPATGTPNSYRRIASSQFVFVNSLQGLDLSDAVRAGAATASRWSPTLRQSLQYWQFAIAGPK